MESLDRYTEAVVDHVRHPRHAGPVEAAHGVGVAENPACGDVIRMTLRLADARLERVGFEAEGCPATMAAASAAAELACGREAAAVLGLAPGEVERALGGLPPGRTHGAELACRALRTAVRDAVDGRAP